jgi:hypothetical protein
MSNLTLNKHSSLLVVNGATFMQGLIFISKKQCLKNSSFRLDMGMPVYENLNGPQMSIHSNLMAGVLYKF